MKRIVARSIVVPDRLAGRRLDAVLAELMPEFSRSRIKSWIESGRVTREGAPVERPRTPVGARETYRVRAALPVESSVQPQRIAFEVRHADAHLIVVNKPSGLVVHPGAGNPAGTLQNGLLHRFAELAAVPRCGLVHRLDAGTSGLLLVARTPGAHQKLTRDLESRRIHRDYRAVARGRPVAGGTIDEPLGRHSRDRLRVAVRPDGRRAVTHFRILARFPGHSFLAVRLETGRTHQIRAHLAHLGFPLAGDSLYARGAADFGRPALHARALRLEHPATGEQCAFEAPLPADLRLFLSELAGEERDWDRYSWNP